MAGADQVGQRVAIQSYSDSMCMKGIECRMPRMRKGVNNMPGFDGTGPRGMGPMTGRGEGYCAFTIPSPGTGGLAYGYAGVDGDPREIGGQRLTALVYGPAAPMEVVSERFRGRPRLGMFRGFGRGMGRRRGRGRRF